MFLLLAVAAAVLVLDQATKYIVRLNLDPNQTILVIRGLFNITHVRNTGAAFGLLSQRQPFFVAATIVAIGLIIFYHLRTKEKNVWFDIALGLELGGALGNLVDRIYKGYVTDFLHVSIVPVFNIADSAIVVGVVILFISLFMDMRREKRKEKPDVPGAA